MMESMQHAGRHGATEAAQSSVSGWASSTTWIGLLKPQSPPQVTYFPEKATPTSTRPHIPILSNSTVPYEPMGAIGISNYHIYCQGIYVLHFLLYNYHFTTQKEQIWQ